MNNTSFLSLLPILVFLTYINMLNPAISFVPNFTGFHVPTNFICHLDTNLFLSPILEDFFFGYLKLAPLEPNQCHNIKLDLKLIFIT